MNGGTCTDKGRHSFQCDCPKATQNSTGYTDSICQTPVFFGSDQVVVGDDKGSSVQNLAGDQNLEFIGLAIVLLMLLLVLLFFVLRYHLRGKERVFINENGEAYIMDETTGTTKRANFDVDVVGNVSSFSATGPTIDTSQGPVKTKRQITMVHGMHSATRSGSTLSGVSFRMPGGVNIRGDVSSSSDLSSSSEDEERVKRMERLYVRRTSDIMLKQAFGDYRVNIKNGRLADESAGNSDSLVVPDSSSSDSDLIHPDDFNN
jgi:hypothetical protein